MFCDDVVVVLDIQYMIYKIRERNNGLKKKLGFFFNPLLLP
jgi:hypothetical protein